MKFFSPNSNQYAISYDQWQHFVLQNYDFLSICWVRYRILCQHPPPFCKPPIVTFTFLNSKLVEFIIVNINPIRASFSSLKQEINSITQKININFVFTVEIILKFIARYDFSCFILVNWPFTF